MWDGSGQEATVEAQTAIPPIIATETESGSQEAQVLTTVYAPMTAETEYMLQIAAATTTSTTTTSSGGSGGTTPQVTPPPTPNPTKNPTPNPVAPPPTTNSGQTNPQESSGFTPSTWAPVTPAPTDPPATNEPTISPTTNEVSSFSGCLSETKSIFRLERTSYILLISNIHLTLFISSLFIFIHNLICTANNFSNDPRANDWRTDYRRYRCNDGTATSGGTGTEYCCDQ